MPVAKSGSIHMCDLDRYEKPQHSAAPDNDEEEEDKEDDLPVLRMVRAEEKLPVSAIWSGECEVLDNDRQEKLEDNVAAEEREV